MAHRTLHGCLSVAALAACLLLGCKDEGDAKADAAATASASAQAGAGPLDKRCDKLGKACGAKDKHQEKIVEECKVAAAKQVEKGCTDKVVALYDCYERDICETINKVWAMEDFRVLADRHTKCVPERKATDTCVGDAK